MKITMKIQIQIQIASLDCIEMNRKSAKIRIFQEQKSSTNMTSDSFFPIQNKLQCPVSFDT